MRNLLQIRFIRQSQCRKTGSSESKLQSSSKKYSEELKILRYLKINQQNLKTSAFPALVSVKLDELKILINNINWSFLARGCEAGFLEKMMWRHAQLYF